MRILIGIAFLSLVLTFLSCQKNADGQLPDNPPGDSGILVISRLYQEYYDAPGTTPDTGTAKLTYNKGNNSLLFSSYYGVDPATATWYYNNGGDLIKQDYMDGTLSGSYQFTRDGNSDVTKIDYQYYGNHTAKFEYGTLPGNIKRTTLIDTMSLDYPFEARYCYFKADEDMNGKLLRLQFLPWGNSLDKEVIEYSYDASGQISMMLDSMSYDNGFTYAITKLEFTQDTRVTDSIIANFTMNVKGKNFWWFMGGANPYINFLYDYLYVGKPLAQIKEYETLYSPNRTTPPFSLISTTVMQNTVDTEGHLTEQVINKDGVIAGRYKFWYEKVK